MSSESCSDFLFCPVVEHKIVLEENAASAKHRLYKEDGVYERVMLQLEELEADWQNLDPQTQQYVAAARQGIYVSAESFDRMEVEATTYDTDVIAAQCPNGSYELGGMRYCGSLALSTKQRQLSAQFVKK